MGLVSFGHSLDLFVDEPPPSSEMKRPDHSRSPAKFIIVDERVVTIIKPPPPHPRCSMIHKAISEAKMDALKCL